MIWREMKITSSYRESTVLDLALDFPVLPFADLSGALNENIVQNHSIVKRILVFNR